MIIVPEQSGLILPATPPGLILPTVSGGFPVVAADPAWHFKSNTKARPGRNALRHYDCMSLADIAALPVRDVVAKDAILFMWITGPMFVLGAHIPIMKAWGFKPTAMGFTWIKLNKNAPELFINLNDLFMGGGFTTRKNAEFCIIGKRGKSLRRCAAVREVIVSPIERHSQKPREFYQRVEQYAAGPYLEMFSRRTHGPNWHVWGDQAGLHDERVAA